MEWWAVPTIGTALQYLWKLRHLSRANIRIVADENLRSVNVQIEMENSSYFGVSRHKMSVFFSLMFHFSSCDHPLLASALAKIMQEQGNYVVVAKDENAVCQLLSMISSDNRHVVEQACSALWSVASDVSAAMQLMKSDIMQPIERVLKSVAQEEIISVLQVVVILAFAFDTVAQNSCFTTRVLHSTKAALFACTIVIHWALQNDTSGSIISRQNEVLWSLNLGSVQISFVKPTFQIGCVIHRYIGRQTQVGAWRDRIIICTGTYGPSSTLIKAFLDSAAKAVICPSAEPREMQLSMTHHSMDEPKERWSKLKAILYLDKDPKLPLFFLQKPPMSLQPYPEMLYKSTTSTTKFPEKMGATAPVEVGTRGTVGSLVMKEIEYFSKLELERGESARKPQGHVVNLASGSGNSWPSFGFLVMTWRRKKRRSSGFRPSICSVVEVADSHQLNGIPGFSYRNLKADVKKFEV
ncbi:hypothetical protein F0562_014285 [Nyssa sinensis]|uniref:Uncharacterized protein n=1 Tax=Nyssa sinensis TaxID=561372 RepID=A0A5J4ZSJ4_9ASTE|nr:hypothetical protein F0562_014285 [Nyssa sinensis]